MKDYKKLNDSKMPKKPTMTIKSTNTESASTTKNKYVGLMIDSSSDSDDQIVVLKPEPEKKNYIPPVLKTEPEKKIYIDEEIEIKTTSSTQRELEPLREVDLPKREKFSSEWKVVDKRISKENVGRRVIKEKDAFVKEDDIDYGDNLYLHSQWDIYCHKKSVMTWENEDYHHIYQINSIGTFCRFFNNFNNLDKITYEFFIMKDKIIPRWEDNANRNGGICSILLTSVFDKRSKTDIGSEIMLSICLLMMNGNLIRDNDKINGISYSLRARNTVVIKIWYNDCKFDMKEQLPFSLFEYFEGRINGGYKNDSISKHISIRFTNIEPAK